MSIFMFLMVGASIDSVIMVEGEMKEISEKEILDEFKEKIANYKIPKNC